MSYYDDPTQWPTGELIAFERGYVEGMRAARTAFTNGGYFPDLPPAFDEAQRRFAPKPEAPVVPKRPSLWRRLVGA